MREAAAWSLAAALALPLVACAGLAAAWLVGVAPPERVVGRVALVATTLAFWLAAGGAAVAAFGGLFPVELGPWSWFAVGDYGFRPFLYWDGVAATMAVLCAALAGLVIAFSTRYLHREPRFLRFFLMMLLFAGAMQLLVAAGTFDLLFVGWELVGTTSVLLIAFFDDRAAPVRSSVSALVVYRVSDLGLLFAAMLLHQLAGHAGFDNLSPANVAALPAGTVTAIGLLLALSAAGKAAQLPFSSWLPRAMEGPTPSSAVFYGAVAVHAGVYLLIRAQPVLVDSPAASAVVVLVGGASAIYGALLARSRPDAKTTLAYASMAQLGLMLVECGLHLPRLALLHLVGHASLRCYQLLRAPNLLADAASLRAALKAPSLAVGSRPAPAWLYRLLVEHFSLETATHRWLVAPLLSLARRIDGLAARPAAAAPPRPGPEERAPS